MSYDFEELRTIANGVNIEVYPHYVMIGGHLGKLNHGDGIVITKDETFTRRYNIVLNYTEECVGGESVFNCSTKFATIDPDTVKLYRTDDTTLVNLKDAETHEIQCFSFTNGPDYDIVKLKEKMDSWTMNRHNSKNGEEVKTPAFKPVLKLTYSLKDSYGLDCTTTREVKGVESIEIPAVFIKDLRKLNVYVKNGDHRVCCNFEDCGATALNPETPVSIKFSLEEE